jgi:diketogulonate reductase-like aldo/keto reductase
MPLIYGTAWKEDDTARLVGLALRAGFRALDTANQRKHYFEAAVGQALHDATQGGLVRRQDVWLQTKFTHAGGQDHRLPYDARAPVGEQVRQSFASSLEHLHTNWIDSYVLHGPSVARGLAPEDVGAWEAMEQLHDEGGVRALGVSNVTREQLEILLGRARVTPSAVQNRCYASRGWDAEVRAICRERGISYQGFSLLTANRKAVESATVRALAKRRRFTPAQLVFRFALDVGMTPLTGTTDAGHMKEDLAAAAAPPLDPDEIQTLEALR